MEKIWLNSYPPGIPAEIDPDQFPTLNALFLDSYQRFSKHRALSNFGHAMSFSELERQSRHFAAWLQHQTDTQPGDRVAIMLPNLLQYPVTLLGILRAGLVAVNINPLYTPRELREQLCDSGARTLVILENFLPALRAIEHETEVRTVILSRMGDLLPPLKGAALNFIVRHIKKLVPPCDTSGTLPLPRVLRAGQALKLSAPPLTGDSLALLQYTGGTTGVSKGAMLTHRNLVANVLQAEAWLRPATRPGKERIVTALPLYHIFSLTANLLTFLRLGGENLLITNPRDLPRFVAEIRRARFTAITGVNTLFNHLLHTPGFDRVDFSRLRVSLGGGMPVQQAVAQRWHEVTGRPISEAYGLTETSPAVCMNPMDITAFTGSIGLPISSTEAQICTPDGQPLPPGAVGEICLRGPQVMKGYWQRPKETAEVLSQDGWLRTGDIGSMDERGFLRIVDRKKDVILVSGFNVYPAEIEDVIAQHPGVLEAAAVGMPDSQTGEAVKLFVVPRDPQLSADDLLQFSRERLTGYKVPRQIEFRVELPKSTVGKILRRELRDVPHRKT